MIKNILMRIIFFSTVIISVLTIWPIFFLKNIKKLYYKVIFLGIFVIYFGIDRFTKYLIVSNMNLHESIPVFKDVFHITYIRNNGAAFGIMPHKVTFFIVVAVISVCIIFYYAFSEHAKRIWTQVALGSILGGALGNLYDRVIFSSVIDFLDFKYINFPVFNFADVVIDIGIFMLFYEIIFMDDIQERSKDVSCIV